MTCTPPRSRTMLRPVVAALLGLLCMPSTRADVIETLDGGLIEGRFELAQGQSQPSVVDADGKHTLINLLDIDRVLFGQQITKPNEANILLIRGASGQDAQAQTKAIKLRAGLHRFVIPYWQDDNQHDLMAKVAGPGIDDHQPLGRTTLRCFRGDDPGNTSPGLDEQGFRLPEYKLKQGDDLAIMTQRARYRLLLGAKPERFTSVAALDKMQLKRSGTTRSIGTAIVHEAPNHFALIFESYFRAPEDGEYTFTLSADDGAQFYLGRPDRFLNGNLTDTPIHAPWHATLAHEGLALGELKQIDADQITLHVPLVNDVTWSLSHVRELWVTSIEPDLIDRDNEPVGLDTAYIRDKTDTKKIVAVSGKVRALDETSLTFEFRDKARTIARSRLVGLVLKHIDRPAPTDPGPYQLIQLRGGQRLPAELTSLNERSSFELIGGGTATPPRDALMSISIENGRRIDMTRITPTAAEAVPYFDFKLTHQVNRSFSGEPIRLINGKGYDRGLAVHSKSRLHYKLERPAQAFRATVGLLDPGGKLGQITARVIGDGKVLWEKQAFSAKNEPIKLDVSLKGVERLVLEVDFGGGQDVGDRAAWCEPQLIYAGNE